MAKQILKQIGRKEEGVLSLPTSVNVPDENIQHYGLLLYGIPGVGKTTLASQFPKAIFFNTEPGSKGLAVFEFNAENGGVKDWKTLLAGINLLEKNPKQFSTIIIDTGDRAYDMCLDYVCSEKGIEYPGKDAAGKDDYGKSWRAVKMEFLEVIHRIKRIGMGLVITSHVTELTLTTRSGFEYHKIAPSMSKQARDTIVAVMDFVFCAENVQTIQGKRQRVLICHGDEHVLAKSRQIPGGGEFPQFLPLSKTEGYKLIESTFKGNDHGINPQSIMVSQNTTKAAADMLKGTKTNG